MQGFTTIYIYIYICGKPNTLVASGVDYTMRYASIPIYNIYIYIYIYIRIFETIYVFNNNRRSLQFTTSYACHCLSLRLENQLIGLYNASREKTELEIINGGTPKMDG